MSRAGSIALAALAPLAHGGSVSASALGQGAAEPPAWYVLGPFDAPKGASEIATPLLPESELRQLAAGGPGPDLARTYLGKGGETVRWIALPPSGNGADTGSTVKIDLAHALGGAGRAPRANGWHERSIAYIYRRIDAESDGELTIGAGSDDALRLWFDGELLADAQRVRHLCPADHRLRLSLRRGANHLFAKVANNAGPWWFETIPWQTFDEQAVNAAIDGGLRYVLDHQLLDGTWGYREDFGSGYPAFAAYVLMKCGLAPSHPAVRMALRQVEVAPPVTTYGIASAVLALAATGDAAQREAIGEYVETLQGWGGRDGLYGYPEHPDGWPREDDLSCTTFAALAYRAAEQVGLRQPDAVWRALVDGALSCARGPARRGPISGEAVPPIGFAYRQSLAATASMTTAGIAVLAMAEQARGDRFAPKVRRDIDDAQASGLAWLARNLDWSWNSGADGGTFQYYTAYGVERVGALLGIDRIGAVDWYREGAEFMVQAQADDGSWFGNGFEADARIDTLLALLFLKRATASVTGQRGRGERYDTADPAAEIQLHGTGDTPIVLWMGEIRPDLVAELALAEDGALDVARAVFRARPERSAAAPIEIAAVAGRRLLPGDVPKLAARVELPANGRWTVSAELELGAAGSGAAPGETRLLRTPEMLVSIDEILAPERLNYAAETRRNLVPRATPALEASSSSGDGPATGAADGRAVTYWSCAPSDEQPWIALRFERAIKVDRIALTHARPRIDQGSAPRPSEIEIVLDGRERHRVAMRQDPTLKTYLDLPRTTSLRELRVAIVACADRAVGRDAVGLAEVELFRRENGK